MPYKINGTELVLQPTSGAWLPREELGIDGNGMPIYPRYRSFELAWDLIDEASLYQVQNFFSTLVITGSVVVDLPSQKSSTYVFQSYTGCILHEPVTDMFWEQHLTSAKLLISRIRTP